MKGLFSGIVGGICLGIAFNSEYWIIFSILAILNILVSFFVEIHEGMK